MKVYLVGIGMEGEKTLTYEARNAIDEADVLIGAERMLRTFNDLDKQVFSSYKAEEIVAYIDKSKNKCAAILLSGDIGFYSGAKKLYELLSQHELHTISGISSPIYLAGKVGVPWENMKFVSLHGIGNNIAIHVRRNRYCFFLLGGNITAEELCKKLCGYNLPRVKVYIGEDLGYPNEKIHSGTAEELTAVKTAHLSVLITENPDYTERLPFIIPESEFYHEIVQKHVPITKAEIRKFVVSSLEIKHDDICWEIGSGTGATTVEMAWNCPDGAVYTIDKQEPACALTDINAHKFSCDNIFSFMGNGAELPDVFPAPDKVFIGGSSGDLKAIISTALSKNPCVRIAVTAVTLETLNNALQVFTEFGLEQNITQLAVTRTNKIGSYTMFNALNPIFLIWGEKNEKIHNFGD